MNNDQLTIDNEEPGFPDCDGWYWCQVGVVNDGLPDLAKVHIDEFDRLTAQFCGCEREFTEDELLDALWLGPVPMPGALIDN
jgi:hypothetical protein